MTQHPWFYPAVNEKVTRRQARPLWQLLFPTPMKTLRLRMLSFLGLSSTEELFAAIPLIAASRRAALESVTSVRARSRCLSGRGGCREECGQRRAHLVSAGGGSYDHEIPWPSPARLGWTVGICYRAYTPYQPEVAQGVLEAIFEYQTMVTRRLWRVSR